MNINEKLEELRTIFKRLIYCPVTIMPKKRISLPDLTIELWVSRHAASAWRHRPRPHLRDPIIDARPGWPDDSGLFRFMPGLVRVPS